MEQDENYYSEKYLKKKAWNRAYNQRLKNAIFEMLGKQCAVCGFDDIRALQIDHVNGGGTKQKSQVTRNYWKFVMNELLNGTTKYQILCANCNWIKRAENWEFRKDIQYG